MKPSIKFNAFILWICILVNPIFLDGLRAQSVSVDQASLVASNFFFERLSSSKQSALKSTSIQNLDLVFIHEEQGVLSDPGNLKSGKQALAVYYIFNVRDKSDPQGKAGFIIVSADRRVPAVLGYSFTEEYSEDYQLPAFKEWMNYYKEQIIDVLQDNLKPEPEIFDTWKEYSGTAALKSTEQLLEVEPLITTHWSQRGYYNNLCPADPTCTGSLNGHAPAGCAAVAMAQIMKYWNYPTTNDPIPGYSSSNYGWQPDIGVSTYDWSNMPPTVDFSNPEQPSAAEIDAVSTIIYHSGVAVKMNYGPPPVGSGAGSPVNAFKDYFKYSPDIQDITKSEYSDTDWTDMLRNELDNNRPVYYAGYNSSGGGGHAFVCDGYQGDDYFHFNFGGGRFGGDDYFYLNDITPGSYDYSYQQWANIGISPSSLLVDADGNYYDVVEIGYQLWMAQNLKTTRYNDGNPIPNVTDDAAWANLSTDAYCWYNNDEATFKDPYGALYNWYAVNTGNLCPAGWRVPSQSDWEIMGSYLTASGYNYDGSTTSGNNYAKALASTTLWESSGYAGAVGNTDYPEKRNATGFTAVPSGFRWSVGPFGEMGRITNWWSSSRYNEEYPGARNMAFSTPHVHWIGDPEQDGFPVRCLKDVTEVGIPVDTEAFIFGHIGTDVVEQWYKFQTGMAGLYAIETLGETDTYMHLYGGDQTTLIAEDNDGSGSGPNAKIVESLDANGWYFVKVTGNNNSTGIFSITVKAIPEAPEAEDVTVTYDGLPHTATASVPPGISLVWYDAATGGLETTQPAGINSGIYTAYAEAVNDLTGSTSLNRTSVTLTIHPALLTVSADNQSSQYSDPLQDLTYDLSGFVNGENASVIGGAPELSTAATQFSAPGAYDILIETGLLSAENYAFNMVNGIYTITQEDARVGYNGTNLVATTSSTSGDAIVTLRAGVQDITSTPDASGDIYPGDIRNARVRFLDKGAAITGTGTDPDGWMIPALVEPADQKTGVVELTWPVHIGAAAFEVYDIGIEVNNYYSRNDSYDNTVLTVYKPAGDFITGGGHIINPENTEGIYAGDPELKTNFGFNVRFNMKGKKLKGNMNILFRRTIDGVVHTFQIKSNSMISLGVNTNDPGAQTAVFVSKVNMRDLSDPVNGYSKGNLILQVNMTDGGKSGHNDAIAISVYDNSLLLFSSNWTGMSTAETALGGGNLVVHSGFNLDMVENQSEAIVSASPQISPPEYTLIPYPNPFDDRIYFDLQLSSDAEVRLEIYSVKGSKIATVYDNPVEAHVRYRIEYVPENMKSGTIIYNLFINGKQSYSGKLIHK